MMVAKPMGVVGAVCPVTNPIVTPMCNAMFALKAGNAVIFAPHPKAEAATRDLTRAFMKIVNKHGGPDNLVQMVKNGSIETTQELMKAVDVVVATGGGAMVKAAYSSGKPSYGVGAGNVPVIIDRDVDLSDAAEKIVTGASFDNGIICSHEQFVLTPEEQYEETIEKFLGTGKVWFTDDKDQVQKLRDVVFPDGHLNKDVVGKSARAIGTMAGIDMPEHGASSCCPPTAPAATTSWPRRSSARSSRSCPTRPSRRRWPAPRRTSSSKAPATRRRCTRTTRSTSGRWASSCRSAGSSSTRHRR